METRPQHKKMVSYLLGQLSEVERKQLEEQYFNDHETFVTLLETEEQLINDYLHNHLRRSERRLFEENYLTIPSKEQKVEFAQLLDQSEVRRELLASSASTTGSKGLNRRLILSIAAGAVALLLIIIGTAVWSIRVDQSELPLPAVSVPGDRGETRSDAKSISIIGLVVSLELPPRPQKSDRNSFSTFSVPIGPARDEFELRLKLTGRIHSGYRARLQRIDRNITEGLTEIAHDDTLKPTSNLDQKLIVWKLKGANLSAGEYQIELQAVDQNGQTVGEAGDPTFYDFNIRAQ